MIKKTLMIILIIFVIISAITSCLGLLGIINIHSTIILILMFPTTIIAIAGLIIFLNKI